MKDFDLNQIDVIVCNDGTKFKKIKSGFSFMEKTVYISSITYIDNKIMVGGMPEMKVSLSQKDRRTLKGLEFAKIV